MVFTLGAKRHSPPTTEEILQSKFPKTGILTDQAMSTTDRVKRASLLEQAGDMALSELDEALAPLDPQSAGYNSIRHMGTKAAVSLYTLAARHLLLSKQPTTEELESASRNTANVSNVFVVHHFDVITTSDLRLLQRYFRAAKRATDGAEKTQGPWPSSRP